MGLDITAYDKLTLIPASLDDEDFEGGQYLFTPDGCDSRLDGPTGYYDESAASLSENFRAGSYSGYNRWRNSLCTAALGVPAEAIWNNTAAYKDKPFFELINYSDCEGAFGPTVSAKLAKDFEDNRALVSDAIGRTGFADADFMQRYDSWANAFEIAAKGGAVILH